MDETFEKTGKDNFTVVLDSNRALGGGLGEKIVEGSATEHKKNLIKCTVENSTYGEHRDLIQTVDSIAREIRDRIRGKEAHYGLKIKPKRLKRQR